MNTRIYKSNLYTKNGKCLVLVHQLITNTIKVLITTNKQLVSQIRKQKAEEKLEKRKIQQNNTRSTNKQ